MLKTKACMLTLLGAVALTGVTAQAAPAAQGRALHVIDVDVKYDAAQSSYLDARLSAGSWGNGHCEAPGLEIGVKSWIAKPEGDGHVKEHYEVPAEAFSILRTLDTPKGRADCVKATVQFQGHTYQGEFQALWDPKHQQVIGTLPARTDIHG